MLESLKERKKEVDEQKAQNASSYQDNDLICCNSDGTPRKIITVEHGFKRLLKENGLSDMRLHDLRHTYATQLLVLNVDLKSISQTLGHTSIKTTADIYISKNNEAASRVATAIESLFSPPIPQDTTESSPDITESSIGNRNSTDGKILPFKDEDENKSMKKVP